MFSLSCNRGKYVWIRFTLSCFVLCNIISIVCTTYVGKGWLLDVDYKLFSALQGRRLVESQVGRYFLSLQLERKGFLNESKTNLEIQERVFLVEPPPRICSLLTQSQLRPPHRRGRGMCNKLLRIQN